MDSIKNDVSIIWISYINRFVINDEVEKLFQFTALGEILCPVNVVDLFCRN